MERIRSLFLIMLFFCMDMCFSNGLELKVVGDKKEGYSVQILYDSKPILQHNKGGEFTAFFQNSDKSIKASLKNWKASRWQRNSNWVKLYSENLKNEKGQIKDSNLLTNEQFDPASGFKGRTVETANLKPLWSHIDIEITYEIVNRNTVKKTIELKQTDIPVLLYSLNNRLEPLSKPVSYWSFEEDNLKGGALHQIFPSAGFRLEEGIGVGLLTDAGYKNYWTSANRRRSPGSGFKRMLNQPDMRLLKVADDSERQQGIDYVEFNFGELFNYKDAERLSILLPKFGDFRIHGKVNDLKILNEKTFKFAAMDKHEGNHGVIIPVDLKSGGQYSISFEYKGEVKQLGLRLWDEGITRDTGGLYTDSIAVDPKEWKSYTQSFETNTDGRNNLFIGRGYHDLTTGQLEIRNIKIFEIKQPQIDCYHPLKLGETASETIVIFVESDDSIRQMRLSSQIRLAEGLGFKGTQEEKIFYATQRMLCWITSPYNFSPLVVPSLSYSPDSYMRDAMWITLTCHDKTLSEKVLKNWGSTQDTRGCIDTIITPCMGSMENVDNDSTFYYLLWSYVNHKRYGSQIDREKVKRAFDFCRRTWDTQRSGVMKSRTPAATDTMWLSDKIVWADNQGIYYNILKACKEMGLDVTDKEIENAKTAYQDLYKPEYGYLIYGDGDGRRDIISPSSLMGEFLSWWLWDEPVLSKEAVLNTLEKLPETEYVGLPGWAYYDAEKGYCYFAKDNHPFSGGKFPWKPGVYVNGGSWLLYDYMAYVAGLKHGWKPAKQRMRRRLEAEFNSYRNWPLNFEWTPTTKEAYEAFPPEKLTKVFGWDCFVLIANEVAGMRNPESDPDYKK